MPRSSRFAGAHLSSLVFSSLLLLMLLVSAGCRSPRSQVSISTNAKIAEVSDRFVSFAIDTAQLVGGEFWTAGKTTGGGVGPVPAFDFTRPRLAALTRPLGHAYLRLGGTDADRTFYALKGETTPPAGYRWLLPSAQFDRASAFARSLDLQIVFTLDAGAGPRVDKGPWQPDNARALVEHATKIGAPVAVWELGNEVNGFPVMLGFGLSASDYARDLATARAMLRPLAPTAKLAGPASAYWPLVGELGDLLPKLAALGGQSVDVLTWHFYPQESARCPVALRWATEERLLDPANLDEIDRWADQVEQARAAGLPHAEVWLDETSNAQCGGAPGISDAFVSSLWWLDELGKLARRGTPVVVRQSLTGADYGLLAEPSLEPRPDYFATVLWRRLMGTRVLAATSLTPMLRVYAHCTAGRPGAVTLLAINLEPSHSIAFPVEGVAGVRELYLATAPALDSRRVRLNGTPLAVAPDGTLPPLAPAPSTSGPVSLPPASYAFVVFPRAGAAACR